MLNFYSNNFILIMNTFLVQKLWLMLPWYIHQIFLKQCVGSILMIISEWRLLIGQWDQDNAGQENCKRKCTYNNLKNLMIEHSLKCYIHKPKQIKSLELKTNDDSVCKNKYCTLQIINYNGLLCYALISKLLMLFTSITFHK